MGPGRGDLGTSYSRGLPIKDMLAVRLPLTIELTFISIMISFILAVPLGVISALTQNTIPDYVARVISVTGIAIPTFVTGLVTIYLLVRVFNWFPPLAYAQIWEDPLKNLTQMVFPSFALGFFMMAFIARVTRSSMLEVLREDYVRTARSKGLAERRVIFIHALQKRLLAHTHCHRLGLRHPAGRHCHYRAYLRAAGDGDFVVGLRFPKGLPRDSDRDPGSRGPGPVTEPSGRPALWLGRPEDTLQLAIWEQLEENFGRI